MKWTGMSVWLTGALALFPLSMIALSSGCPGGTAGEGEGEGEGEGAAGEGEGAAGEGEGAAGEGEGEGAAGACGGEDATLGAAAGLTSTDPAVARDNTQDTNCNTAVPGTVGYSFTMTIAQPGAGFSFDASNALTWAQSGGDPDLSTIHFCNGGALAGVNLNNAATACDGTDDCVLACTLCFATVPTDLAVDFQDQAGDSTGGVCVDLSGA